MNRAYREYLIGKWKEAEDIGKEIGCTDNKVIICIFDKITQPFYYWTNKKI